MTRTATMVVEARNHLLRARLVLEKVLAHDQPDPQFPLQLAVQAHHRPQLLRLPRQLRLIQVLHQLQAGNHVVSNPDYRKAKNAI